jgi:hypothetical protein
LVGTAADDMLHDEAAALRHLDDNDATRRSVALNISIYHWRSRREVAEKCEEMAVKDPDQLVRRTALLCLGTCYRGSKDRRIGRILALTFLDKAQPTPIRDAAYQSLVSLHSVTPQAVRFLMNFRFPEDVAWEFVVDYCQESREN